MSEEKLTRIKPDRIIVENVRNEPRLYQTSMFYDKEAAKARWAPAKYVETSKVKVGLKYEGTFKP